MTRSLTKTLVGTLAVCLALSGLHAAEKSTNPFLAKPLAELKTTIESSDSEIDRIRAAAAVRDLLKASAAPSASNVSKKPKKSKKSKKGKAPAPVRQITAADRKLCLDAAAIGIGDSSCAVRHYSRKSLTLLGKDAIGVLTTALAAKDINKLQAACLALYDMGGGGKKATTDLPAGINAVVPGVTKALQHDSYVVREAAGMACRGLGPVMKSALPQIIKLLGDEEFSVANAAVYAVAAVDPSGKKSVPALVKTLDSPHDLREFICVELGAMGQKAGPAVPAIAKVVMVDRDGWHAGKAACLALTAIVVFNPKDADGKDVEDKVADVRPIALAAIIDGYLNLKTAFRRADCRASLFIQPHLYCPFGNEAKPLIPKVMADLRQYMGEKPTRWEPPRQETCNLAVRIAQTNPKMKKELIAVVKELSKDEKTHETYISMLEKMLKALEG